MFLKFLFCLSAVAFAQTITYTGYSDISQKAAEEEAAAGVAKQISATVSSTMTVDRGETRANGKTELSKDMRVRNTVKSSLFLKGLKFSTEPKQGKNYVATASLDLQELTSAAREQLKNIQKRVSEKEGLALAAVKKGNYTEASRLLAEAETESRPYQNYVDEISVFLPIDASMTLKSDASKIQSALLDSLRGIKILVPSEVLKVDASNPLVFKVTVQKNGAIVERFPVSIEHNGRRLAEAFSDERGEASFRIPAVVLQNEPYTLKVLPGINLQYRKESGLNVASVEYSMDRPQCRYAMECDAKAAVCSTISQKLGEAVGVMVESENAAPIEVSIETEVKNSVKQLSSYNVNLYLKKDGYSCMMSGIGAGKNEADAVRAAISKMNFSRNCNVQKFCEE